MTKSYFLETVIPYPIGTYLPLRYSFLDFFQCYRKLWQTLDRFLQLVASPVRLYERSGASQGKDGGLRRTHVSLLGPPDEEGLSSNQDTG